MRKESLSFPELELWYAPDGILAAHLKENTSTGTNRPGWPLPWPGPSTKTGWRSSKPGPEPAKSLAYLLPALLWALRNKERVVISTNTINLQEQLTKKDIPFLREHGGYDFRAVLVKGRSNYLCKRKLETVESEPALLKDETTSELEAIIAWSRKSAEGSRGDLSFIPRDELWEEVCCEADQCGRVKCPHYGDCFFLHCPAGRRRRGTCWWSTTPF